MVVFDLEMAGVKLYLYRSISMVCAARRPYRLRILLLQGIIVASRSQTLSLAVRTRNSVLSSSANNVLPAVDVQVTTSYTSTAGTITSHRRVNLNCS